jgi:hypothetical protein
VLTVAVSTGFALTAFTAVLLAFAVGSAHSLKGVRKRIVYVGATAAVVTAFVGGALISIRVGSISLGALIIVVALFSAVALVWTVRLG